MVKLAEVFYHDRQKYHKHKREPYKIPDHPKSGGLSSRWGKLYFIGDFIQIYSLNVYKSPSDLSLKHKLLSRAKEVKSLMSGLISTIGISECSKLYVRVFYMIHYAGLRVLLL